MHDPARLNDLSVINKKSDQQAISLLIAPNREFVAGSGVEPETFGL